MTLPTPDLIKKSLEMKDPLIKEMADKICACYPEMTVIENTSPDVSVKENFNDLEFRPTHPFRGTAFFQGHGILRTFLAVHYKKFLSSGMTKFIIMGPVYRDVVQNRYTYKICYQLDIVSTYIGEFDVSKVLDMIVGKIIPKKELFSRPASLPFAEKCVRKSVSLNKCKVDVAGGGYLKKEIVANSGLDGESIYAMSFNLDRLAMAFYGLNDICVIHGVKSTTLEREISISGFPSLEFQTIFDKCKVHTPKDVMISVKALGMNGTKTRYNIKLNDRENTCDVEEVFKNIFEDIKKERGVEIDS